MTATRRIVLFVDDEPLVREGLRRIMRPYAERWEVLTAAGGDEALEILSRTAVDVLVSDLRMPGMDGVTLLKQVQGLHPRIRRIVLSGAASNPEDDAAAVEVSHLRLTKPCARDELLAALEPRES